MGNQLERIRRAYDLTVEEYDKDRDPFDKLPAEFRRSTEFTTFLDSCKDCNSGCRDIKLWLSPQPGMRFLDAGCAAGLASYRLDRWPSTYYGVDISPGLIQAMKGFVSREGISVGGLYVADIADTPFADDFFDIAAVIGVFEYHGLTYIRKALAELKRILKPGARIVMDIPNQEHLHNTVMVELESLLGRPHVPFSRSSFEDLLKPLFDIDDIDDAKVMIKYFARA